MNEYFIVRIFFLVATLYSSIGFGGGSSYLAILALVLADFYMIRSLALVLNIAVVVIGTIGFVKAGLFRWKLFWPFLLSSIPEAFLGEKFRFSQELFFVILGVSLLLSSVAMFWQLFGSSVERSLSIIQRGFIGTAIGLLSGVAGIGGGIFLSPVLNISKWQNAKIIAALSSAFILTNSMAGLLGIWISESFTIDWAFSGKLIGAVVLGGLLGSFLTRRKFELKHVRVLTAILVAYVGLRILLKHSFEILI